MLDEVLQITFLAKLYQDKKRQCSFHSGTTKDHVRQWQVCSRIQIPELFWVFIKEKWGNGSIKYSHGRNLFFMEFVFKLWYCCCQKENSVHKKLLVIYPFSEEILKNHPPHSTAHKCSGELWKAIWDHPYNKISNKMRKYKEHCTFPLYFFSLLFLAMWI